LFFSVNLKSVEERFIVLYGDSGCLAIVVKSSKGLYCPSQDNPSTKMAI